MALKVAVFSLIYLLLEVSFILSQFKPTSGRQIILQPVVHQTCSTSCADRLQPESYQPVVHYPTSESIVVTPTLAAVAETPKCQNTPQCTPSRQVTSAITTPTTIIIQEEEDQDMHPLLFYTLLTMLRRDRNDNCDRCRYSYNDNRDRYSYNNNCDRYSCNSNCDRCSYSCNDNCDRCSCSYNNDSCNGCGYPYNDNCCYDGRNCCDCGSYNGYSNMGYGGTNFYDKSFKCNNCCNNCGSCVYNVERDSEGNEINLVIRE